MKKVFAIFLLVLTLPMLFLPCDAETIIEPPIVDYLGIQHFYKTWEEYEAFVANGTPPDHFLAYEDVQAFGKFNGVYVRYLDPNQPVSSSFEYFYVTMDGNHVSIVIDCTGGEYESLVAATTVADLNQMTDMRSLSNTSYEGKYYLRVKDVCFIYDENGNLYSIVLRHGEREYELNGFGSKLWEYPHLGMDTLLMRLLNVETVEETIDELHARLDGAYKETVSLSDWLQKPPVLVGIGIASGAVVAAAVTWLITYFVMRKKRGALAPAPAMAGIPAGEVSAGSDGDASAAPAAPESPAPPEETPPPEAAATDTPTPEETPPPDN